MSETVSLKLNGKDVQAPAGWTVMQVAQREGVRIPHFCWHPGLSVAGVCRFCMVHVEGARKLEIACNLPVREGMVVRTDLDEVKEAHKWALEFHLVNHPLDCPICDQAGECGLQDYYMEVGKYRSEMTRPKVLKPKALDVGSELVLDTERCILCARCVRFEEEVTKTGALGIFDRGDRAIIGVYGEEKLEHNYQENLVDICPVGAFTSKNFRFKQRVWFLKESKSVCPGCSTGCAVNVHARPELNRYYRVKPREDAEVNGHWLCDKGRMTWDHLNPEVRLNFARVGSEVEMDGAKAVAVLKAKLQAVASSDVALLVSAQLTNEEATALLQAFVGDLGVKQVYQWRDPHEDREAFDGLLWRGDHNANTAGLMAACAEQGLSKQVGNEFAQLLVAKPKLVIAVAPERPWPTWNDDIAQLAELPFVSLWTTSFAASQESRLAHLLPLRGFAEKTGHFTNYAGKLRSLEQAVPALRGTLALGDILSGLKN